MENDDIRFKSIGNNEYCMILIFPTIDEAIQFENRIKAPKLHLKLQGNDLLILIQLDTGEVANIPVTINNTKVSVIKRKGVTHLSVAWPEMNLITDIRCLEVPVEYHLYT